MRLLVVDSDTPGRKMVLFVLETIAGHEVIESESLAEAEAALNGARFDALVVDLMDRGECVELCKRVRRRSDVPIIVVSDKSTVQDRVRALRAGADDVLSKPFDPSELIARVDAIVRRAGKVSLQHDFGRVDIGDLSVDLIDQTATIRGRRPASLTRTELRLITALARTPGQACASEELERAIYPDGHALSHNTIQSYISGLRRKLEPDPGQPRYILTVRKYGYRLGS
ncbi:MAG: response regulator transcription factor [Chloroflexota bacterium]